MSITFDRHPGSAQSVTRSRGERTLIRRLASRVYLPTCFVTVGAAVLIATGWISHWGGANFTGTLLSIKVSVIGPATLVIIGVLMIAERVWPAQKRSPVARGYRQDALYTILNSTLTLPLIAALSLSFSDVVRSRLPWLTFPRLEAVPHLVVIGIIVVAMDGCNWAAHLANHRSRSLWRFHELHHSQEDMSVLTVFRTHPFVHIVYVVALIPGIVLLANGGLSTSLLVAYAGSVALAHSNIRLSFGPVLGRIFVSPNFHRIHHRVEGRQDVNLGFALTIWDQMFKTAVFPTWETVGIDTGLPGRTLIVEQEGVKAHYFKVFLAQLKAPWRPLSAEARVTPLNADEPIATKV